MATIIKILAQALRISEKELFRQAALAYGEAAGTTMYQSYVNRGEIPAPVLKYCRELDICSKCGIDLTGRKTKMREKSDGVDLRECFDGCPPKAAKAPKERPHDQGTARAEPSKDAAGEEIDDPLPQSPYLSRRLGGKSFAGPCFSEGPTDEEVREHWKKELD